MATLIPLSGFWILEVNSRVLIQIYCILTMEEYGQNGHFDPMWSSEVYLENVIRRMPEFGCCIYLISQFLAFCSKSARIQMATLIPSPL